jgi:glycosyltransferase involved in cell wall biosynthesis
VASHTTRKNLASLDATARRLANEGIDLVAAGGERPQFRENEATQAGARALGHVPDAHLPGLYAGASAFVLPSWHEGFGLTCIEAMACGVPVVAARAGALPETCGDAARYADPFDPDDIATQVLAALGDDRLREAGPQRAALFTWERTARELDVLLKGA